jgi:hypothetical protein
LTGREPAFVERFVPRPDNVDASREVAVVRTALLILFFLVVAVVIGAAAVLMFDEPVSPPELTSVTRALDAVDFSSLPGPKTKPRS